jgi:hypothetical protein
MPASRFIASSLSVDLTATLKPFFRKYSAYSLQQPHCGFLWSVTSWAAAAEPPA